MPALLVHSALCQECVSSCLLVLPAIGACPELKNMYASSRHSGLGSEAQVLQVCVA
jgi:hypothetical protein